MIRVYIIIILFSNLFVSASNDSLLLDQAIKEIDINPKNAISKLSEIRKNTHDIKTKIIATGKIGTAYYYLNNLDSSIYFFNKSKNEAVKNKFYSQSGIMYNNLGIMYSMTEVDTSFFLYSKALDYFVKANDSIGIIDAYVNIGAYFLNNDQFNTAIDTFNTALSYAIHIQDTLNIATIYTNIAIAYSYLEDKENCLKYNILASKIFYKIKNYKNYLTTTINMGAMYLDLDKTEQAEKCFNIAINAMDTVILGNYTVISLYTNMGIINETKKDFKKAAEFYNKSLELSKKTNNVKSEASAYINIAGLNNNMGNFDKTISYANKALDLSKEINSKENIAGANKILGITYNKIKEYKRAIKHLKISTDIYLETENLHNILEVLQELKYAYNKLKDYKNALKYANLFIMYNDSVNGIETKKTIELLNTKYETEKKEKQIITQQADLKTSKLQTAKEKIEKEKQQTQRNLFVIAFVLMLILAIIVLRSYKQKKKANILLAKQKEEIIEANEELNQQNEEITAQRDEIITQKEIIEEVHHEISESINYATRLQEAILPESKILSKYLSDHFVLFKPKDKVSGDFYWWAHVENHTIITAADCTGHGVPGAFMSMLGSSFLREIVQKEYVIHTGVILRKLRKEIIKTLKQTGEMGEQKDGMDMAIISINHETNMVQFSGANNPIYIIRNANGETLNVIVDVSDKKQITSSLTHNDLVLYEIKPDKMPISIYEKMDNFTTHEFKLEKGDRIYMFSDGFADQFGGHKEKKFMYKPFKRLLLENANKPMVEQKIILNKAFEDWKGSLEQIDDIVILGITINPDLRI